MKTAAPTEVKATAGLDNGIVARNPPGGFSGTDNPRHLRVLHALLRRAMPREQVDREAGCSNGPDLVTELRERGLDVPCTRVVCFDRDHREVKRGIYNLTARDRARLHRWLAGRSQ